jgi:hypothetical protein
VLPIEGAVEPASAPVYLSGEIVLPQTVHIVSVDGCASRSGERRRARDASSRREGGDCEAGWRAWKERTWHATRSFTWQDQNRPAVEARDGPLLGAGARKPRRRRGIESPTS